MINKYGIALLMGVAAGVAHVAVAHSFDLLKTSTVVGGVFALVLLAALGKDLCRNPSNLGDLQEERPTLIGALMFMSIFTLYQIYQTFGESPEISTKPDEVWIYGSWGPYGKCQKALKIGPGPNDQLAIETGGEHLFRQILEPPTDTQVKTQGGTFDLGDHDSMTSTVQGYRGIRFERCRQ